MDGSADLTLFARNLKMGIRRSQSELAREVTKYAHMSAKLHAPVWKGDLKNKISMKTLKKRGEVFIAGGWLDQAKAKANEFGIGGENYVNRDGNPEIDEWAIAKGYFNRRHPNFVKIGGIGTALGKKNKFFELAFIDTQNKLPMIMTKVIEQILMRNRG